ncbi:MAG: stalk domain-containing protein [Thermoanaerobacterales bacterium]|nr:stalk domain-containing protein [Thermoanaerobacterales bacterium]
MLRRFFMVAFVAIGLTVMGPVAAGAAPRVLVGGRTLALDVPPVSIEGRLLIPFRPVLEAAGAEVEWDGATVTATRADVRLCLYVGRKTAYLNGQPQVLDVPPMVVRGRTMVPLRFVGESLGYDVSWDKASETAIVNPPPPPFSRDYRWRYNGCDWHWKLQVPAELYEYFHHLPRLYQFDEGDDAAAVEARIAQFERDFFLPYATEQHSAAFLAALAGKFEAAAGESGFNDLERAELVITFIQECLPYTSDPTGYEQYPVETLVDGGDCEDRVILAAALLRRMGYGTAMLRYEDHVALGLACRAEGTYYPWNGKKYFYVELTSKGWRPGKAPEDYKDRKAQVYEVPPCATDLPKP